MEPMGQSKKSPKRKVYRHKYMHISAHIKSKERSQINDLMLHLRLLEK
jgi:hypothetical protein